MTDCSTQLTFSFFKKRRVTATFTGGELTTDAGLLLVREFEHRRDLIADLSRVIPDPRDPRFIVHPQVDLLRQRVYQIIAGYEDCNDATRLRNDGLFKVLTGRLPDETALGSQPTLSRLENRIDRATERDLGHVMLDWFIESRRVIPKEITLDMDASHFATYGQQLLTFFNGKYNEYGYFPLFVTDGETGFLLASVLRPGNESRPDLATNVLDDVVCHLRAARRDVRLLFRGDSAFGVPVVMSWLEDRSIDYAVGIAPNVVLERLAAPFVKAVEERFASSGQNQRDYTSFEYSAKSWDRARRILVKVEVTALGTNTRFVVTSRRGGARDLFEWSNQRGGTVEHAIEELRNGFSGDRLSCHSFEANAFRLLLHTAAHNIMVLFRQAVGIQEIQSAKMPRIRVLLLKVAGRIRQTARRVWFELSSSWPFAPLFHRAHRALMAVANSP